MCFMILNIDKIKDPKFSDYWKPFYDGETKYLTKLERAYKLVFIVRRVAFVSIAFFIKTQYYQIILMYFLNLVISMYYASTKPLIKRRMMYLSIINEYLVSVAIILIGLFTDYVPQQDSKYFCGWIMCSVVGFMIFINMTAVLLVNIYNFNLVRKKYCNKWTPPCKRCCKKYFQNPDPEKVQIGIAEAEQAEEEKSDGSVSAISQQSESDNSSVWEEMKEEINAEDE